MKLLSLSASRVQTALGGLILISLVVGFLCISFIHATQAHAVMSSHSSHKASSATLNACCDIGVSDHMELWKGTLVGIPQSFQDLLVLIVIGVVATFVFSDFFTVPKLNINLLALCYRQYVREHPNIGIFNPLKLALARGILHPKTYQRRSVGVFSAPVLAVRCYLSNSQYT